MFPSSNYSGLFSAKHCRAAEQLRQSSVTCDLHHGDVSENFSSPVRNEAAVVADEVLPFHEQYALLLFDVPTIKE